MSVGQREPLVRELLQQPGRVGQFLFVKCLDIECRQLLDEIEELNRPVLVISAKEPAMSFRDNQGRSRQGWWV